MIGKLVMACPLNEIVLAMPYRHRQTVEHVSLPPSALAYGREHGAKLWVVRFDKEATCFALPLAEVERVGWLHASEGRPEWFVPLSRFRRIPWQSWPFVEQVVRLETDPTPAVRQLRLWG